MAPRGEGDGRQRDRWGVERAARQYFHFALVLSFSFSSLRRRCPASLLSPIENAPRQMKIYRSGCPVGGFNLICHTVVARDCQGAVPRNKGRGERECGSKRRGRRGWELLLVRLGGSVAFKFRFEMRGVGQCYAFKYDEWNIGNVYSGIIDRFKWQEKLILRVVIINCWRLFVQISVEVLNIVDIKFKYWKEEYEKFWQRERYF